MSGLGSFLKALSEHKCTSMLSFLNERGKRWRIDRRFPIRWLTYRARVQRDVEAAFKLPNGKEIFDYNYVEGVTNSIKQLEEWQVNRRVSHPRRARLMNVTLPMCGSRRTC